MRNTSLLSSISLAPGTLRAVLLDRLTRSLGKHPDTATQRDIYDALSLAVREELAARWLATQRRVSQAGVKRVCYLSVEFLLGRALVNGLSSLDGDLVQEARDALRELGFDLDQVAREEIDPGLGNGGLGRLAACFLDSLATLSTRRSATASATTTASSPRPSTRTAASARSPAAGCGSTTCGKSSAAMRAT